ncbi:MAG: hypothetical protein JWQ64_1061, partial [Subtercola sp.]|nr:hypothetical protein [Subtercola sp.]
RIFAIGIVALARIGRMFMAGRIAALA